MPSPKALLLALANALIPIAILVFATGFFPYKPFMQGLATYEESGWENKFEWNKDGQPKPMFDKLVFMVVDALRSDFVYAEGGGMGFVQRYVTLLQVEERSGEGSGSSVC
jgi:ethanolaminephosphotransferase